MLWFTFSVLAEICHTHLQCLFTSTLLFRWTGPTILQIEVVSFSPTAQDRLTLIERGTVSLSSAKIYKSRERVKLSSSLTVKLWVKTTKIWPHFFWRFPKAEHWITLRVVIREDKKTEITKINKKCVLYEESIVERIFIIIPDFWTIIIRERKKKL